jgi:hypothetical protein
MYMVLCRYIVCGLFRSDSSSFAWGFIKSKVYTGRRTGDLAELRNRIIGAVRKITPQMLEIVFQETIVLSCVETLMVAMYRQINSTKSLWHLL